MEKFTGKNKDEPLAAIELGYFNYYNNMSEEQKRLYEQTDALTKEMNSLFRDAYGKRNAECITRRMADSAYARASKFSPWHFQKLENKDIPLYAGVYAGIRNTILSHMRHMVKTQTDKPFTLEIDKLPDPAPYIKEKAISQLVQSLQLQDPKLADPFAIAQDALAKQKDFAYKQLEKEAKVSAYRHEALIEDQLTTGNFPKEWEKFFESYVDNPSAFMLMELVQEQTLGYDANGKIAVKEEPLFRFVNIPSLDVYPTIDATSTQNGTGQFIVQRITINELLDLAKSTQGLVNKNRIYEHIRNMPYTGTGTLDKKHSSTFLDPHSQNVQSIGNSYYSSNNIVEVIRFIGKLPRKLIEDYRSNCQSNCSMWNMKELSDDELEKEAELNRTYTCDVWMIGGKVVWAARINMPDDAVPFYSCSWLPQPNSYWGVGLYDAISTVELAFVGTMRQMYIHGSHLTYPMTWLDRGAFGENQVPNVISPSSPLVVDQVMPGSVPIGQLYMQNNTASLANQASLLKQLAETIAGVPQFLGGGTDIGSAARTSGIFSALQANATKNVELHHLQIAREVTIEIVKHLYRHNILFSKDESIKATLRPVVKGIEGLAERDARNGRIEKLLQYVLPLVGAVNPQNGRPLLPDSMTEVIQKALTDYAINSRFASSFMLNSQSLEEQIERQSLESGIDLDGRNVRPQSSDVITEPPIAAGG